LQGRTTWEEAIEGAAMSFIVSSEQFSAEWRLDMAILKMTN